ncbi:hypothetical protein FGW37_05465 [Streptomyces rectiverticillatus]|uniref:hypothetical protein n=1 Tax=Streptomyces rectiverticillatus TaxID=173860 RepID=UPI0015C31AA8|nr:hypothetical protein [Streptomyces rectiverticillatus]QLE71124.1 hypothetical protein FGW37_05465 [Streptomyces rectiverticillatus]
MAVRQVVLERLCDPCKKAGKEVVATGQISVRRSWDLCPMHEERYDTYLGEALGDEDMTAGTVVQEDERTESGGQDQAEEPERSAEEPTPKQSDEAEQKPVPVVAELEEAKENRGGRKQKAAAEEEAVSPQERTVVVTGEVSGYKAAEVRQAVEALGYKIVNDVDANTSLIICGRRPATTKVHDARYHKTPVFDASQVAAFREALTAGEFPTGSKLPEAKSKRQKSPMTAAS